MNLELSEEQEQLAAGLRELLVGSGDIARVREFAYEGGGRDAELWEQLVEASIAYEMAEYDRTRG